jgi:uncharacterized protein (TIGR02231 family)
MRYLPIILSVLPLPLWAADISLQSNVSAVTLYPQGATVTREVAFSAPAGQHQLILADLPGNTPLERVRVEMQGATMGSVTARNDYLPPLDEAALAAEREMRAEVERLEREIAEHDTQIGLLETEIAAAEAQVRFLEQLGDGEGVAALGVSALRDLTGMVGDETLAALKVRHAAEQRVLAESQRKKDTQEALDRARKQLAALQPGMSENRAMLSISISTDEATEGTALITYTIDDAGWLPVYDLRLNRDSGVLSIERGAFITQYSGENWQDVALTLSTLRPSEQTVPGEVWPWLRRVVDPDADQPVPYAEMEADTLGRAVFSAPIVEPAISLNASASFDGLSVTYSYPEPVSIANGADRVRIALGVLETTVDLTARAVPLSDQTAFLMASLTNDTEELILPTLEAMFYIDERFVGQRALDLIPAGGAADLSFGPIDGLRLTRTIIDRNEGDRGLIAKSNEQSEHVRITVDNLTGEAWPIRLLDHVPYSEQEDLRITWNADLPVSEEDVDGKRGVLGWTFDLPAGESRTVNLTHKLEWPAGQILR